MLLTGTRSLYPMFWGLGIRKAHIANQVALAKLNWRFHHEPDSPWAKVLRSKYGSVDRVNRRPSPVWRSLCKGKELFKKGILMVVRNSALTNFWFDNWLGKGSIRSIYGGGPVNPSRL